MTFDASHESEIARAARALRNTIVRERHATESARRLAPPVHRALIDAGLHRLASSRHRMLGRG